MKIGDIYDFQIGDEFQFKSTSRGQGFPNADRILVIDKIISANKDSIIYTYHHDQYTSILNNQTQHLDYSFSHYNTTEVISNLDSTILSRFLIDTTSSKLSIYFDSLCSESTVGFIIKDKNNFEPTSTTYDYGKGLGLIKYEEYIPSGPSDWEKFMFYYDKQGFKCGTPDLMTSIHSMINQDFFKVYPNPVIDFLTIDLHDYNEIKYSIFDFLGNTVFSDNSSGKHFKIDLSRFRTGVYLIQINNRDKIFHQKIIKQ